MDAFMRDAGMSTRRCRAPAALRMRVNMSAMGSVIDIFVQSLLQLPAAAAGPPAVRGASQKGRAGETRRLPARLDDARNLPAQRQLAEADAAHAEIAQEAARPPAAVAPVATPHLELRLLSHLGDERFGRHSFSSWPGPAGAIPGARTAARLPDQLFRKGMFMSASSSRDSSSVLAVVTTLVSMP